jgi:RNA polymerase-binding transcription factor DksA
MKTQYSEKELKEFKTIIETKLKIAEEELKDLQIEIKGNPNGVGDRSLKIFENGLESSIKEELTQRAQRQLKFVSQLKAAMRRIDNKTYGVCMATGKLISKDRLRVVPHCTMTMEAKTKRPDLF